MRLYHSAGHSYLVCPRLVEIDSRHGEHWSKGPPCRHGDVCPRPHKHEKLLAEGGGHRIADFHWIAGCRPPTEDEHPLCGCGERLVHADLDDLYDPKHLAKENA